MIDLRSDTVTKPSAAMLAFMMQAQTGDDVFSEDPTVKELEQKVAAMFDMEAGLFCPSGTMSNQIAIKAHTQPLDELICDKICHIYNYETGGWAFHSGISIRLTDGLDGRMTATQIEELILPQYDWLPNTRMVAIENTVNKGGGSVYTIEEMKALSDFCKSKNLIFHLDGARIFNALEYLQKTPADVAGLFDSISVCFSKGLGAPVGSMLLGKKEWIAKSRKIRKVMGGGMRQSGLLAAACLYALKHNVNGLAQDHANAKQIATALKNTSWVKKVLPVVTNIVLFEVENAQATAKKFEALGIRVQPFSVKQVRIVTHLDFTEQMLQQTVATIETIEG